MSAETASDPTVRPVDGSMRRLAMLALPMMAAHVTQPLLGLVDAAVIGRLGEVHLLGAVAIGAIVFDLVFWGLGSLRMSTAAFTSQAFGAGHDEEMRLALARAVALSIGIGVLIVLLQAPITWAALAAMGPAPPSARRRPSTSASASGRLPSRWATTPSWVPSSAARARTWRSACRCSSISPTSR